MVPFTGMPAAPTVQQSLIFAQLEILRRINRLREGVTK